MFLPEKRSINKFQREDARVTEEYVNKIMKWITDRDIALLRLLLDHPFLTIEQLEMMAFTNLKPSSWRNKANERIRRLYHSHCVDRFFPPVSEGAGSAQQHIVLDRAGAIVLARHYGHDPDKMNWKKRVYVPQTYKHTLKILDFKAMLSVLNRQIGVIDGEAVGEVILWQTEHKAKMRYVCEGKKGEVIPDALCIYKYRADNRIKLFFLEVDNATEGLEQLQSKIRRYVDCYKSGMWKETNWAKATNAFPVVLILFHEEKMMNELRKYAKSLKTNIKFLFSTYDKLTECTWRRYESKAGKHRHVLEDMQIKILEPIWKSSKEEGMVAF